MAWEEGIWPWIPMATALSCKLGAYWEVLIVEWEGCSPLLISWGSSHLFYTIFPST